MKFLNKCVCIILVLVNIILMPLGNVKAAESNDELHQYGFLIWSSMAKQDLIQESLATKAVSICRLMRCLTG